ncbi:MAG: ATP-binding protein [Muribaculaceae bacterium]|nr:ATP-binding protein [Muribaculaceae bacterium]
MATVRIKNVGPLVDTGSIELASINLFIGKQSSGKSTLLKILCFCRWIDKQVSTGSKVKGNTAAYAYSHHYRFVRDLMHFYRFNNSFFSEKSEIDYEGDAVDIKFKGNTKNNAQITVKSKGDKFNSKICFIPSERNLLSSMKNIQDGYRSSDLDMLFNFVFEWGEFREKYTSDNKLSLTVAPEMEYYYDKEYGEQLAIKGKNVPPFSPFYASSGIQSAFPLEVIVHSLVNNIGQNAKLSQSDLTQILARLIRDGASSEQLQRTIESGRNESRNLLTYQGMQIFIEEPEQNLFPESQSSIIWNIVKAVKAAIRKGDKHRSMVVMTTHSPYVLSALNVLMAASEAFEIDSKATKKIVEEDYILDKGDIRAYRIDQDGLISSIVDSEPYMVDGNFLDGISENVEEHLSALTKIICSE